MAVSARWSFSCLYHQNPGGARHLHHGHLQAPHDDSQQLPTTNHGSNHRLTATAVLGETSTDHVAGPVLFRFRLPPSPRRRRPDRTSLHLGKDASDGSSCHAAVAVATATIHPAHPSTSPPVRARERRTGIGGGGGAPSEGDGRAKGRSARRRSLRERHDSNVARLVSGERQVGRVFVCSQ